MSDKLLTEHHLECLRLKGGFKGSSESTLVKVPHSWKSHVAAHLKIRTLICRHVSYDSGVVTVNAKMHVHTHLN